MHSSVAIGGPTQFTANLNLVALFGFAIVDRIAVGISGGGHQRSARDRGSYQVIVVMQLAAFAAALAGAYWLDVRLPGNYSIWVVAGLALVALGSCVRGWAILALGRDFNRSVVVRDDQELVTSGPYRWLRHPAYTGLLVGFTGFGFALDNVVSVAILGIVPTIAYLHRIRVEEAALEGTLGLRWEHFAAGRRRLIPGVW